jgi:hypothetical protein
MVEECDGSWQRRWAGARAWRKGSMIAALILWTNGMGVLGVFL